MRATLIAVALVCVALSAQAQVYGTLTGVANVPSGWTAGSVVDFTLWVELDNRDSNPAGLAGMDVTIGWDPTLAELSDVTDAQLWFNGAYFADDDQNLSSNGDWLDTFYVTDPPGPGLQDKILDWSTDTYLGAIPGADATAGTNLFPLQFQVTPGASEVFFQGYQNPPADFSIGSEGNPYPFAHLALTLLQDVTEEHLCLSLRIDTLGQLRSPTNTVDRILFDMPACPDSPWEADQEVSIEAGQVNEYDWLAGLCVPEPGVFVIAGLGLLALLRRRK